MCGEAYMTDHDRIPSELFLVDAAQIDRTQIVVRSRNMPINRFISQEDILIFTVNHMSPTDTIIHTKYSIELINITAEISRIRAAIERKKMEIRAAVEAAAISIESVDDQHLLDDHLLLSMLGNLYNDKHAKQLIIQHIGFIISHPEYKQEVSERRAINAKKYTESLASASGPSELSMDNMDRKKIRTAIESAAISLEGIDMKIEDFKNRIMQMLNKHHNTDEEKQYIRQYIDILINDERYIREAGERRAKQHEASSTSASASSSDKLSKYLKYKYKYISLKNK
jgi:hypothetical protein